MELDKKQIKTLIFGVMGCIVLYWALNDMERIRGMLGNGLRIAQPFLVGACIAFILNVPLRAIEKQVKKIHNLPADRTISILLTLTCVGLVVTLVFQLLIPQVRETAEIIAMQLPVFIERMERMIRQFLEENPQIQQWLWENTDLEKLDWGALVQQAIDLVGDTLGQKVRYLA